MKKLTKEDRTNKNLRTARRVWKRRCREQYLRNLDLAERRRELKRDMASAHAEGLHDEIPREGCPECEHR